MTRQAAPSTDTLTWAWGQVYIETGHKYNIFVVCTACDLGRNGAVKTESLIERFPVWPCVRKGAKLRPEAGAWPELSSLAPDSGQCNSDLVFGGMHRTTLSPGSSRDAATHQPVRLAGFQGASRLAALSAMAHSAQQRDIFAARSQAGDFMQEDSPLNLESEISKLRAENSRLTLKLKASSDDSKRLGIS